MQSKLCPQSLFVLFCRLLLYCWPSIACGLVLCTSMLCGKFSLSVCAYMNNIIHYLLQTIHRHTHTHNTVFTKHILQNFLAVLPWWFRSSEAQGLSPSMHSTGATARTSCFRYASYTMIPSISSPIMQVFYNRCCHLNWRGLIRTANEVYVFKLAVLCPWKPCQRHGPHIKFVPFLWPVITGIIWIQHQRYHNHRKTTSCIF